MHKQEQTQAAHVSKLSAITKAFIAQLNIISLVQAASGVRRTLRLFESSREPIQQLFHRGEIRNVREKNNVKFSVKRIQFKETKLKK